MKRIIFSDQAKADLRAIQQQTAMRILNLHRLAETGVGPGKTLKGQEGEKRLRVGDFRVRFTEEGEHTLHVHTVKNRKDAYR